MKKYLIPYVTIELVFILLKIGNVITLAWRFVLFPIWFPCVILLATAIAIGLFVVHAVLKNVH